VLFTSLPPLAGATLYGVKWVRRLLIEPGFNDLPSDEDKYSITESGDLQILNMQTLEAGMYVCLNNAAHEAVYLVGFEEAAERTMVWKLVYKLS